ncbi:hypothetical protein BRADI_2g24734v3 [Brachypodium distachyon]|uniref:Uncharacterized protein n=1 Tax=Brachypodium distachyon TaxID=15368 RepID=A0A2K2DA97_BRADI|nr:hypothetical protein BRADI_2g24734v3 [Brachypodium distachyon]
MQLGIGRPGETASPNLSGLNSIHPLIAVGSRNWEDLSLHQHTPKMGFRQWWCVSVTLPSNMYMHTNNCYWLAK